jgi:hypothetical protein
LILEKSDAFPRSLFLQVLLGREFCAVSDLEAEAKRRLEGKEAEQKRRAEQFLHSLCKSWRKTR